MNELQGGICSNTAPPSVKNFNHFIMTGQSPPAARPKVQGGLGQQGRSALIINFFNGQ